MSYLAPFFFFQMLLFLLICQKFKYFRLGIILSGVLAKLSEMDQPVPASRLVGTSERKKKQLRGSPSLSAVFFVLRDLSILYHLKIHTLFSVYEFRASHTHRNIAPRVSLCGNYGIWDSWIENTGLGGD